MQAHVLLHTFNSDRIREHHTLLHSALSASKEQNHILGTDNNVIRPQPKRPASSQRPTKTKQDSHANGRAPKQDCQRKECTDCPCKLANRLALWDLLPPTVKNFPADRKTSVRVQLAEC